MSLDSNHEINSKVTLCTKTKVLNEQEMAKEKHHCIPRIGFNTTQLQEIRMPIILLLVIMNRVKLLITIRKKKKDL